MLGVLIEKEIRDITGTTKFVLTFAVSAVLILLAFYTGAESHKQNMARWEAAVEQNIRQLDGVTDWLRVRSLRVFLPPQPLATLVSGVSNDVGRTSVVHTGGEVETENSRYNEEPTFAVFRFLDLEFVFQIVLSLFAILLGYDAISGEKERGTLKLCMANAVPRNVFLLGKFIGSYVVLAVSLLIPIAIGCLLLPVLGVHLTGGEWLKLALIVMCGFLFFGAFLSLALFVSSFTQRTASSFLLLLVVWVGSVLILPRAAVLIAGRAVDVPSVDEVGYQKAAFATDQWRSFAEDITKYEGVNSGDMEAMMAHFQNYMDSMTTAREEAQAEFQARVNEERLNAVNHRADVVFTLARVTPSVSMSLATTKLAGTSSGIKQRFYEQATQFQDKFKAFLFEKTGMKVGGRMTVVREDGLEHDPIDPSELPVFTYEKPTVDEVLAGVVPDFGLLILFNLVFFAGAMITFRRYDAR